MALNASVVGAHKIEARRIDDGRLRRPLHMFTAWPVATFAANVPLGDRFGLDVVIDRVTAVARRSCWAFEIIRRIERGPPVRSVFHEIRSPDLVCDIPLRRFREIVIPYFLEVALLPFAPVDKGNVIFGEVYERIRFREVGQNCFGMLFGIDNHVGHACFFPALIDLRMTGPAGRGADIVWGAPNRLRRG